ncbi:alpha/beta fold hydrolase [Gordonia hankookensis]|uniref:Alpha/beta fold hydrolase n=1 Tax=Gordonia hankookensis TaxID=589403 RepID=A0ABR7WBU6_9ACTN|nr:alpha/beta fold hydrolase [Gordonia hankookensis]MBD1319798.1 alpha/beta fold hydrolase [Gordonia hankookensis]
MTDPGPRAEPVVEEIRLPDGTVTPLRVFVTAPDRPTIVLWPGLGVPAAYFDLFACRCGHAGVNVVVGELRGQGRSRPRPSRASRFGQQALTTEDIPAAVAVARRHAPTSPLFIAGHSMGGHIASMFAARNAVRGDSEIAGLILVASGVPYWKLYRGGQGLLAAVGPPAMHRVSKTLGYWPGSVIEGYGRQSRVLIRDWTYLNRNGTFAPRDADVDYEAAMRQLRLPVCAITVGADTDAPPRVMSALTAKLADCVVDTHHVAAPLGHNRWARDARVPAIIADWVGGIAADVGTNRT